MTVEIVTDEKHISESSLTTSSEDEPYDLECIDPKLEARIRRKFDSRVVPVATLIYFMAFIDRQVTLLRFLKFIANHINAF
jgi:hypothetical protein